MGCVMVKLKTHQVCPYGSFCGHADDELIRCHGLNPDRPNVFICELWAENYENHVLKESED